MNELQLLRRYEPVVAYTDGELFFPTAIEHYVEQASLWMRGPNGQTSQVVPRGQLTASALAGYDSAPPGSTYYLRFVETPLTGGEFQRWLRSDLRPEFKSAGRLSRVGLVSRIIDSLFDVSLLVRGRVPGGTTGAAHIKYIDIRRKDPRYVYYGRVLREGGYIVLHYLYFFPMNNWRSSFYGVNDHEADWEQAFVFLSVADDGTITPEWVACAVHDYNGDNLRRRWDDPTLRKHNETHPVIYAGAGSHAFYFEPGEYLTEVAIPALQPMREAVDWFRHFWRVQLGQGTLYDEEEASPGDIFSIPFIDYARGDGLRIGPDQPAQWTPIIISNQTDWVRGYRGLWGLDTRDFFGGERAPAGPRYARDGSVRQSWHNPLGWCGLHKVPPRHKTAERIRQHLSDMEEELTETQTHIVTERENLRLLGLEVSALQQLDHTSAMVKAYEDELLLKEAEVNALYARAARIEETIDASHRQLQRINQGDFGNPAAHLNKVHRPEEVNLQDNRAVEFWAAVSTGLFLLIFIGSLVLDPSNWLQRSFLIIVAFITIEASLRGRIIPLLLRVVVVLAAVATLVLFVEYITWITLIALILLAYVLISANLREFFE